MEEGPASDAWSDTWLGWLTHSGGNHGQAEPLRRCLRVSNVWVWA